jgi:uncharacterized protein
MKSTSGHSPGDARTRPRDENAAGHRSPRAGPDGAPGRRPQAAWVAVAVGFGITLAARSIIRDGGDPRPAVAVTLIVLNLATVGVVILLASRHGRPRPSDFGLRSPPLARATVLVIAVLGATLMLSAVWAMSLGIEEGAADVPDRLAASSGTLNALVALVLVAVATPLGEEFLFRAYYFLALRNRRGFWPAAVMSSIVFAAFHVGWMPPVFAVPTALFGLGACLLYRWTGSLYPSLAMHALLNSAGFAPAMGWTWQLPLAIAFSVTTTITAARLIALLLGGASGLSPAGATRPPRAGRAPVHREALGDGVRNGSFDSREIYLDAARLHQRLRRATAKHFGWTSSGDPLKVAS